MNRRERRKGKWGRLDLHMPFADASEDLGPDTMKVLMVLLRKMSGEPPVGDEELYDSVKTLVDRGFLAVWMRTGPGGVEIHHKLLFPQEAA